jgi:hypothetical protein
MSYRREIHRPLNQLLVILPLLVLFHVGSEFLGSALLVPVYLRDALGTFGVTGRYLPAGLVLAVLVGQHVARKDRLRLSGWVAGGMIVESAFWVLPVLAMSWLTRHGSPAGVGESGEAFGNVLEAIGAGVYEEFLFRLVFLSASLLLLVDLLNLPRLAVTVGALCVSGLLFSACHFPVSEWSGPAPRWGQAVFLALAGAWWGVLYLWRGYAVAACSHVVWDLLVIASLR